MYRTLVGVLVIAPVSLFLGIYTLQADASQIEEAMDACGQWLEGGMEDASLEAACISAVIDLEPTPPSDVSNEPSTRPAAPALILGDPVIHDGDRAAILERLSYGESVDIIVEFEVRDVLLEANGRAIDKGLVSLGEEELAYERAEFARIKADGLRDLSGITVIQDYENLPSAFIRVESEAALSALLARSEVKVVFENIKFQLMLAESLPLIHQPEAQTAGFGGAGAVVAVFDTGVDYIGAPFGCVAPGNPTTCKILATFEATVGNDGPLDTISDDYHGTNVSSIVAGAAPDAGIVVADIVEPGGDATVQSLTNATNWVVGLLPTHNIVAVNLSFGVRNWWEEVDRDQGPCLRARIRSL